MFLCYLFIFIFFIYITITIHILNLVSPASIFVSENWKINPQSQQTTNTKTSVLSRNKTNLTASIQRRKYIVTELAAGCWLWLANVFVFLVIDVISLTKFS